MSKVKTRIYFCGGAGFRIGELFHGYHEDVCYIDTSVQNKHKHNTDDNTIIIEADTKLADQTARKRAIGMGKDRKAAAELISSHIPAIAHHFPAGDANIVVYSMGGASGSTIGPSLVSHLQQQGEVVVSVVIGSYDSDISLRNSSGSLKTFEGVSSVSKVPMIINYHENVEGIPQSMVNQNILEVLNALVILFNQEHQSLDLMDITNWAHFHKHHDVPVQTVQLHVCFDRQEAQAILDPISIASLYTDPDRDVSISTVLTRTTGYADPEKYDFDQMHFVINGLSIEDIRKRLEERREMMNRAKANMRKRQSTLDVDDQATSSGLVFD
ncbi:GTPase activation domain-containing protein [Pseudomonas aeruginosa]|uniref:Putative monomeric subunit of TubZ chain A n=1 Tax=Pseudomonas phage KTN4 TaxID=1862701 RepID=A0A192Y638_9CAUD|nr:putative monomeric subunit of TubZ chain A [Pseudomonas phage KTN4]QOV07904.1 tubulin-like protein [Pseudomonas phage vB_PaeM_kmuB]